MLGNLNRAQIDQLLYSNLFGRIGCHADGKMYIVPITYAFDGQYIIGHTIEGLKVKMMRMNPSICFQVDNIQDLKNWQSAIIWGTYEELKNAKGEEALQKLVTRLTPFSIGQTSRPVHGLDADSEINNVTTKPVIFSISIDEVSGKFEKN